MDFYVTACSVAWKLHEENVTPDHEKHFKKGTISAWELGEIIVCYFSNDEIGFALSNKYDRNVSLLTVYKDALNEM
jgi:hypothetical protein